MKNISYIATIIDKNYVELSLCDEIPDFVHAVKYDEQNNVEIYFSADDDWTPELEAEALDYTASYGYTYHATAMAV